MTTETATEGEIEVQRPDKGVRYDISERLPNAFYVTRVPFEGDIVDVARVVDGVLTFQSEETKQYRPPVVRNLNKAGIKFTLDGESVVAPMQPQATSTPVPASSSSEDPAYLEWLKSNNPAKFAQLTGSEAGNPSKSVIIDQMPGWNDLTIEQRKAIGWLRRRAGYTDVVEVSPAPPKEGPRGDKEEAFVEWTLRYDPVGFATRYRVEKLGSITVKKHQVDANNVLKLVSVDVEGVLAGRKTHMTLIDEMNPMARKAARRA